MPMQKLKPFIKWVGEKLITDIDTLEIHSLHKKLKDSPQDIVKENLFLLKELIKK